MKILLLHNFYRSSAPSGEDNVYLNERDLLVAKRHDVVTFELFNDDIDDSTLPRRIHLGLNTVWSKSTYKKISQLIRRTGPEVAHFHSNFPIISPSGYAACKDNGVPVVHTLRNYRYICPGGMLIRNGLLCEACLDNTFLLPAFRYRCYRDSFFATGTIACMILFNKLLGTFTNFVDRYIALTSFAAKKLEVGGLPRSKIAVKPNFLPNPPEPGKGMGGYATYVGRLSKEKGLKTLLLAFNKIRGIRLKILGSGPMQGELEELTRRENLPIDFLGRCSKHEVLSIIKNASFIVVPSEWYEGFPMVVLEAYACGTPVLASRLGSLDEVVIEGKTGLKFMPGNAFDLSQKISYLLENSALLQSMRENARSVFEQEYTEDRNYLILKGIYGEVIENSQKGK